ncbi:MAG: hypothetical protein F9K22_11335 [Bacteroidetes bacterium]|nr:MAG: hypothetical protein F9K22_11335 [Bacteroidota bacterium]
MQYSLSVSGDRRFVITTVHVNMTRELAKTIVADSQSLGRAHGLRCYLQDLTGSRNEESVFQAYSFAHEDMSLSHVDRGAVVAVLVQPEDHSHDFVELVCRNAGLNMRLFRDRESAERYLRSIE